MTTSIPKGLKPLRDRLAAQRPESLPALDRLRARYGDSAERGAFVAIAAGRCPVCRVGIAAVEASRLRAGEIVTCPSCGRFLHSGASAAGAAMAAGASA